MEQVKKYFFHGLFFVIIFLVFKTWFQPGIISGGDFWPGYSSMRNNVPLYPFAWHWGQSNGLGGNSSGLLWFFTTSSIITNVFGTIFSFNVELVERFGFLYSFLIVGIISPAYVFKKIFPGNNFWLLSSAIFVLNTYILMIVGGGQIFIMLAYAISPLAIYSFLKLFNYLDKNTYSLRYSILTGVMLALQIMFDIRLAYIFLFAVGVFWLLKIFKNFNLKYFFYTLIFVFIVPGVIAILLHAFWILPTLIFHQNPLSQLGSAFTTTNAVQFLSFAKLEDSISLLQPNWPENIFGKTYFMRPEFLMLPILAFSSLIFIEKLKNKQEKFYIIFFSLLGLLGAFLAKGASNPFGGIYLWMFDHIPGFMMFRDPTKWYTLVVLSYSILIPFSVWKIYELLKSKAYRFANAFLFILIFYLLFLIRPALFGQLTGIFRSAIIPAEYIKLEKFLASDNNFSRTLWVPVAQRFEFYSNIHPTVSAQDLFNVFDLQSIGKKISESQLQLREMGIKYLIVPYDSQKEIFLDDRKFDENKYLQAISIVGSNQWLKRIEGFGRIAVFEVHPSVGGPKDHFWSNSDKLSLRYSYISPVEYTVEVKNAKVGDLVIFSESFDPNWKVKNGQLGALKSQPYQKIFNSFVLEKTGNYMLDIYYQPQEWVNIGLWISGATLLIITILLLSTTKKHSYEKD